MAAVVELVKRRDFGDDISSVSLLGYTDGFQLPRQGWIQAAASGDGEVAEAMTLYVEGSSHNDLADKLKLLDDKIQEAAWYRDGVERYGVWLRAKLPDEGGARQALVTGMRCEPAVSFYGPLVAPGNFIRGYELALTRMPYWEATSYLHSYGIGSLSCTGGLDGGGLVQGNVPARIAQTEFRGAAGGGGPLYEFWLGFRTDRFGVQENLATVWDLGEFGVGSNDTTTDIVDATAYNGYGAQCTFGTETELKRIQIALHSVTTDYEDQRGSYIVLMRAKVDAGTTCQVRLKDGFLYTSALRTQPRVEITSTDWLLHALGTVNIPPSHGVRGAEFLRQYGLEIHASRTAGSGSDALHMDCFILVPCAEGVLHITGAAVQRVAGDLRPATVVMTADGRIDGWAYQSNLPRASLVVEPGEYALPTGNVSFVLAGQRETSHVLTDAVGLNLRTYRRWRSLRGHDDELEDWP